MLWACVLLPQLAQHAVLRRCPDPQAPLALVGGPAQLRTLQAVNAAAAAAGVQAGMRLTAAHALLPGLALVEHDPQAEARWQRFLAAWAYRHSSLVSAQWPGCIVLEVRASFALLGPWPRIEARLREELALLGFSHRIGLAPTPRAAQVLAGLGDGLAVTQPAAMTALPFRPAAARTPRAPVWPGRRPAGVLRAAGPFRRAAGAGLRGREPHRAAVPAAPPGRRPVHLPVGARRRRAAFRAAAGTRARPQRRDGGAAGRRARVGAAVRTGAQPPGAGAARAAGGGAAPAGTRTAARDLFDPRTRQQQPWPQLRERLRARLGDSAVHRITPTCDPRPERAWRPLQGDEARIGDAAPGLPPRPGWLLPQPVPLRDPRLRIVSGPERLESGWWDGDDARRDYYVLETSQGQRAWAFAPPGEQGGWMLHGWFA